MNVYLTVPADPGSEGGSSTEEPQVKICTWRPDVEETSGRTPTADGSDVTMAAPTVDPELLHRGGEQPVMAASLPAVRGEVFSGTCDPQQRSAQVMETGGTAGVCSTKKAQTGQKFTGSCNLSTYQLKLSSTEISFPFKVDSWRIKHDKHLNVTQERFYSAVYIVQVLKRPKTS